MSAKHEMGEERSFLDPMAAHELKNALTGVRALVQLGQRNPAEAASHARLAVVEKELVRIQAILRNSATSLRPRAEVMATHVELGPLVAEVLRALSGRADEASVRLLSLGDATVEADRRQLSGVVFNLVANGIEATAPGGEVVVEVRHAVDEVEIAVRDTGRGMAPEALRRLGTPFFTTRAEGTGLGVLLARTAMARHGGTLRYESEPGKGTIALARFPLRARAA